MEKLVAIARIEKGDNPILLFPTVEANVGNILAVTIDGHTEVSLDWYRKHTKPAKFDERFVNMLGYREEELELRKRLNMDLLRKFAYSLEEL